MAERPYAGEFFEGLFAVTGRAIDLLENLLVKSCTCFYVCNACQQGPLAYCGTFGFLFNLPLPALIVM